MDNNFDELSGSDLKDLIFNQLKSSGIDTELLEIDVKNGPFVIIRGEIKSDRTRELIKQVILEEVGISKIKDELHSSDDDYSDEDVNLDDEDNFYDEDNEYIGTEDVFRSVEDGIPYIPPTSDRRKPRGKHYHK